MDIGRNAAAVIHDRDGTVQVDGDINFVAVAGQGFVDGVIDDLVDQVMQPLAGVEPMYMAGRFRTAESPSRTLILSAP